MTIADTARVLAELHFWQEALRAASQAHDALPAAVRREIDHADHTHELMRMIPVLAGFSSHTRQRMESLLADVLLLLDERVRPGGQLRAVPPEDQRADQPAPRQSRLEST